MDLPTPPLAEDTAMMRFVFLSPGHPWFLRANDKKYCKAITIDIFAGKHLKLDRCTAFKIVFEETALGRGHSGEALGVLQPRIYIYIYKGNSGNALIYIYSCFSPGHPWFLRQNIVSFAGTY